MEPKTKLLMYAPVLKNKQTGKYMCILSDDSIDRENEIIGKDFLLKVGNDFDYVPALANHDNNVFMQVGEWVNKRIEKINGHNALVAEPKFYKSNPNSAIIKGMLDEGAKIGISIGAIPKDYKDTKIDGKSYREYTDGELLEASFVAIPANSHARAMAVAKSLGNMPKTEHKDKSKEESTMEDDKLEEYKKSVDEKLAELTKMIEALTKSEEPEEKPKEEPKEEDKVEAEKQAPNPELEKMKTDIKAKDAEIANLKEKVKDSETKYKEIYEKTQKEAPKGIPVLK
jgi:hypothetical protein